MNTKNPKNLEEKAWYRIAKVLYGIGWLFVILIAFFTIYVLQPNTYMNMDKSYFTCPDGIKYNTKGMTRNYLQEKILSSEDDQRARATCAKHQVYSEDTKAKMQRAREEGWTEDEISRAIQEGIVKNPSMIYTNDPIYKLTLIESTNGSWGNAFTWAIAVVVVGYGALELIKKVTLYILLGNKS